MKKVHIYFLLLVSLIFLWSCQNENISPTDSTDNLNSGLNKKGGSALEFDGSTGYVDVPDDPSLAATNELTISAWVYFNSTGYPPEYASIVTKGAGNLTSGGDNNNYTLHSSGDGRFYFTATTTTSGFQYESDNTPLSFEAWHHVAVTFSFDGTTTDVKFYIDGSLVPTITTISSDEELLPNTDDLIIGADFTQNDEYWSGRIDEVRIWNEVLSASQITTSMHGSATPRARALVGYWRFNEGSGLTVNDRSHYHNDGMLIDGVNFVSPGI